MLITEEVEIPLGSMQIAYYENLGYMIPKNKKNRVSRGTKIVVKIEDLQEGSHALVKMRCDYCGREKDIEYKTYNASRESSYTKKDCCGACVYLKVQDTIREKYNVENIRDFPKSKTNNPALTPLTYDFVKAEFEKVGYMLITKEYKNNLTPLEYICLNHIEEGIQISNYANLKHHGSRCEKCGRERTGDKLRLDFKIVKKAFEDRGYILLSDENEYKSDESKLRFICPLHKNDPQEISYVHLVHHNQGCRECYKEKMSEMFSGEKGSNWQGGLTPITKYLRKCLTDWKKDSMRNCNYKCVITGENFNAIHHLYGFNKIVKEIFIETDLIVKSKVLDYTDEELKIIKDKCIELHNKYPLGICLTSEIHNLFHSIYGTGDNISEQFYEFKERYNSGEFDTKLIN